MEPQYVNDPLDTMIVRILGEMGGHLAVVEYSAVFL